MKNTCLQSRWCWRTPQGGRLLHQRDGREGNYHTTVIIISRSGSRCMLAQRWTERSRWSDRYSSLFLSLKMLIIIEWTVDLPLPAPLCHTGDKALHPSPPFLLFLQKQRVFFPLLPFCPLPTLSPWLPLPSPPPSTPSLLLKTLPFFRAAWLRALSPALADRRHLPAASKLLHLLTSSARPLSSLLPPRSSLLPPLWLGCKEWRTVGAAGGR